MADKDVKQYVIEAMLVLRNQRGNPFNATATEIAEQIPEAHRPPNGVDYHVKVLAKAGAFEMTSEGPRKPRKFYFAEAPDTSQPSVNGNGAARAVAVEEEEEVPGRIARLRLAADGVFGELAAMRRERDRLDLRIGEIEAELKAIGVDLQAGNFQPSEKEGVRVGELAS